MTDRPRVQLADYLQAAEIETHILAEEEDSVRADWWRASCALHDWYTTGSRPNVEDAAAHHVSWDHSACADTDPDSPANAPLYCRSRPDHDDDHWNGGRTWTNDRKRSRTARCRAECSEMHTYIWGECEAAVEPEQGAHPAGATTRDASHYFATDRDRESFLSYFGDKLDTWSPEFAQYVRTGAYPPVRDGFNAVPETSLFAMQQPEYEAENQRLWKRAAEADFARVQAELRVAKLRLVLSSALVRFTKKRRGGRGQLRSGWVDAARVELWRRVFEETAPARVEFQHPENAEPGVSESAADATSVRWMDTGAGWFFRQPDASLDGLRGPFTGLLGPLGIAADAAPEDQTAEPEKP